MKSRAAVFLAVFSWASLPILAQTADRPAFEVAAIKPNHSASTHAHSDADHGRLSIVNWTLKRLIARAYDVREDQISGPSWLAAERFDIVAKAGSEADGPAIAQMLQSLLADRFKIELHRDTKEERVYALVVAKGGAKLKPVESTGESSSDNARGVMTVQERSMADFARTLSRDLTLSVVDETGLAGIYSFKLTWDATTDELSPGVPSDSQGLTIYTALQQQLGLRLEPRKLPIETLVIDHIDRVPTEN